METKTNTFTESVLIPRSLLEETLDSLKMAHYYLVENSAIGSEVSEMWREIYYKQSLIIAQEVSKINDLLDLGCPSCRGIETQNEICNGCKEVQKETNNQ